MRILQKKLERKSFSFLETERPEKHYRIVIGNIKDYKTKAVRQLSPNNSRFRKIDNGRLF